MSTYAVNKLCRQALHDTAFRDLLQRDPEVAMATLPLTEAERKAFREGDVAKLYEWGASGFLLSYLTRWELFGLTVRTYSERMRAVHDPR